MFSNISGLLVLFEYVNQCQVTVRDKGIFVAWEVKNVIVSLLSIIKERLISTIGIYLLFFSLEPGKALKYDPTFNGPIKNR